MREKPKQKIDPPFFGYDLQTFIQIPQTRQYFCWMRNEILSKYAMLSFLILPHFVASIGGKPKQEFGPPFFRPDLQTFIPVPQTRQYYSWMRNEI